MAGTAVVFYGLIAMTVVVGAWMATRGRERMFADARTLRVLRSARRRALAAIGFAIGILVIGALTATLVPQWLGIGAAVAPALAGAGGLLLYAVTPPRQDADRQTRYSASLQPRTAWNVSPRGALVGLGIAVTIQVLLLSLTGAASSPDDQGRYRAITVATDTYSSTSTPFPGWFYAAPLIGATAVLAIATWIALRSIASTASLPGEGLEKLDGMWRSSSARIIIGLSTAAICFQLGATSLFAGTTMGPVQFEDDTPTAWQVLAAGLTALGLVSLIISIVALTLATLRAFALAENVVGAEPVIGGTS